MTRRNINALALRIHSRRTKGCCFFLLLVIRAHAGYSRRLNYAGLRGAFALWSRAQGLRPGGESRSLDRVPHSFGIGESSTFRRVKIISLLFTGRRLRRTRLEPA